MVGTRSPLLRSAALLLLVSAQLVYAQDSHDQDLMSLSLEDLSKTKVFSASRHLEETRSAPSAVTIITSAEMARYGWRTLGDVLNGVRGFYTSYDRDYTYLGVRGIQRPGDYNSRILLMLNGHRLNDNIYDSAAFGTEFVFDLDLVDHIEIVRGPSSSLFGTNAVFGVINIITRRPPDGDGTTVEASGTDSSFLGRSGQVTGTYRQGQLSAILSGGLFHRNGVSDLYFPEFSGIDGGIAHHLDGERSENVFADLQYGGFRLQGIFGSRTKDIPTAAYGADFDTPEAGRDSRGYLEASYHRSLSGLTDLDVRTYYDWYNFFGSGQYSNPGSPDAFIAESLARADWFGTEAVIGRQIGQQRITVGTDFEYSPEEWQKNVAAGQLASLDATHTFWLAAVYGEAELHFIPKVTIRAGGRLDWFDVYGAALSPRAAAIYQPNSKTALKYIFGRAFRAPNAYEEYYADGVSIVAPTSPLEPEHITSHEVVFERTLKPWLSMTADGFYNNLTDLIDEVPDPVSGLNHFVNIGKDRGRGFEFEIAAKRESGLAGQASYTFTDASDKVQQADLASSPASLLKLHGVIPATRHAFVGMELLYTSSQNTYQATEVRSSTLTNFTLSSKPLRGWELSASCYDAFNQHWYAPAGPELVQPEIRQDGRTFRFKLNYRLRLNEKRSTQ